MIHPFYSNYADISFYVETHGTIKNTQNFTIFLNKGY